MHETPDTTPPPPAPSFFEGLGKRAVAAVLAWLLPGAGHWMLGCRGRAALQCACILGLFWGGQALAGCYAVNRELHPIFYAGQIGNGLSTLISDRRFGPPLEKEQYDDGRERVARGLPPYLSTGINFTTIAGLLNMLLVLHVLDPRTWRARAADAEAAEAKAANAKGTPG